ncbi:MAG: peptide deformylase [Nocardioidaceae bacterium]
MSELPSGGTPRPIARWGEPVMHARCQPVTSFGDELATLVQDMVATMYAAEGVGLAANQVGVSLRVFVFDCHDAAGEDRRGVVCNPVLEVPTERGRELDDADEGCLSLPGGFVSLARPNVATVTGVDHQGEPVTYTGDGFMARCLQHEADHLDGIVFADRLSTRMRKRLYKEAGKVADEFPSGWPVVSRG